MNDLLDELTQRTRGLVSRKLLLEHFSEEGIRWLQADAMLYPVRRSVYRAAGVKMSAELDVLAAVLACGPDAVASHRSAIRLWNLQLPVRNWIEVTIPDGRNVRRPGIHAHRTNIPSIWTTTLRDIPVMSVERTLLEASCFFGRERLERAMEDALVRRLTTLDDLARCFNDLATQGRRRFTVWREILQERTDLKTVGDSVLKVRIKRAMLDGGCPEPVEEFRVATQSRNRYLDLAYPDLKIGIECDGRAAHETVRFNDDRKRDREMMDWLILRFTALTPEIEIVADVKRALALRAAA